MKTINILLAALWSIAILSACTDEFDNHYTERPIENLNTEIEISDLPALDYLAANSEYATIRSLLDEYGVTERLAERNQEYTMLVYSNEALAGLEMADMPAFAQNSVCDISLAPSQLENKMKLLVWSGRYLRVKVTADTKAAGNEVYIADQKVSKIVRCGNAYMYVLDGPVPELQSLYQYFESLDDAQYSIFKRLVREYETKEFDQANSTPVGTDNFGNTVYDSVFITVNTYLDRYTNNSYSTEHWNMRSENYESTMLVPSDEVLERCLKEAYENTVAGLGRPTQATDTLKFHQWIINACFYNRELTEDELSANNPNDLTSIAAYGMQSSTAVSGCQWRPSVQLVDIDNPVTLSNGLAYPVTYMKIPNNIVIWRIKNRMYPCWSACTEEEKAEYFQWNEIIHNVGYRNVSGTFGPIGEWPAIDYTYLYGQVDPALVDSLDITNASLTFTLISVNDDGSVSKVMVPPGEYTLSAGSSYTNNPWTADWYLEEGGEARGEEICEGWIAKNAFLDRYGDQKYAEFYDLNAMKKINSKAANYDRDGLECGIVRITGNAPREVKLRMVSPDLYKTAGKNDTRSNCLALYHWTLRPTSDNY